MENANDALKLRSPHIKAKFSKLTLSSTKKRTPPAMKPPSSPKFTRNTPSQSKKMLSFSSSSPPEPTRPSSDVNNILRSSISSAASKSIRLSSQPFSQRLQVSDTDATHCSLISNDGSDVIDTEMERLEFMDSSSDIFAPSKPTASSSPPLNPQLPVTDAAIVNLSAQVAKLELLKKHPSNESHTFRKELYNSILTISSASTSKGNQSQLDDTLSSMNSDEICELILISDSDECIDINRPPDDTDSYTENVSTVHSQTPDLTGLSSQVVHKLNHFFDNIPAQEADVERSAVTPIALASNIIPAGSAPADLSVLTSLYVSATSADAEEKLNPDVSACSSSAHVSAPIREFLYVSETDEEELPEPASIPSANHQNDNSIPTETEPKSRESQLVPSTAASSIPFESNAFNHTNMPTINFSAKFNIRIHLSGFDSSSSSSENSSSGSKSICHDSTTPISANATHQIDPIVDNQRPEANTSIGTTNHTESNQLQINLSALQIDNRDICADSPKNPIATKTTPLKTLTTPRPRKATPKLHSCPARDTRKKVDINGAPNSPNAGRCRVQDTSTPNKQTPVKLSVAEKLAKFATPKPRIMPPRKRTPPPAQIDRPFELDDNAQRVLNELYGNTWQTPEVLNRCVKRTAAVSARPAPKSPELRPNSRHSHDFSIFRQHILSDLESTRIVPVENTVAAAIDSTKPSSSMSTEASSCKTIPETPPITQTPCRLSLGTIRSVHKKVPNRITDDSSDSIYTADRKSSDDSKLTDDDSNMTVDKSQITQPEKAVTKGRDSKRDASKKISSLFDDDTDFSASSADEWQNNYDSSSTDTDFRIAKKNDVSKRKSKSSDSLTYLDLTSHTMIVDEDHCRPNATDDDLKAITDRFLNPPTDKEKENQQPSTPLVKTKRKLFTPNYEVAEPFTNDQSNRSVEPELAHDVIVWRDGKAPAFLRSPPDFVRKVLERNMNRSLTAPSGEQSATCNVTPKPPTAKKGMQRTVSAAAAANNCVHLKTPQRLLHSIQQTPRNKYGFLRSLDVFVPRSQCHPDALMYRDKFKQNRDELTALLLQLFNDHVFDGKLNVPIKWNNKLKTTAGYCCNLRRQGVRSSSIDLSDKVVTSCDRLRCTLIHELCHAATWVFSGDKGHGPTWKKWAQKAMETFKDLPIIDRCHQYEIVFKYTYKCTLCGAKSKSHSKSKKVEQIRCAYCHGSIEILLNKKDRDGNVLETPIRKASGFALFVKERYNVFKAPGVTHAEVMRLLSADYSQLSKEDKEKY